MSCSLTQPRSKVQECIPLYDAVITEAVNNAYSAKAKAGADPSCKSLFRVAENVAKAFGYTEKNSRLQLVYTS